ncbi:MAG: SUMF1/EgtB/PvdO family nonheme iron enzyme, partial [Desulfosarcina sp.]|nr:SUMF1/EgtB/PvdO family nonheme iron enzyme [Desulfobacterales bacterium]
SGYNTEEKRIRVNSGRYAILTFYLDLAASEGSLYVNTDTSGATIKVLNIGPKFYQGIELDAGTYKIKVSKRGYISKTEMVDIATGRIVDLYVELDKEKTASAGENFINSIGQEFVYIRPGTFMMGSPSGESGRDSDETRHKVTLTKGFYMQTTEVTVWQWRSFVQDTGYKSEAETGDGAYIWTGKKWKKKKGTYWNNPEFYQTDRHPVTCISWNDVQKFIKWLNRKEGSGKYRLPTEAEWEYTCRAGTKTPFDFGDCLSTNQANYDGNYPFTGCPKGKYREKTVSVSSFSSNAWGLYDMHGNVWEWCQDSCDWKNKVVTDTYRDGIVDPLCTKGSDRVYRGGSWRFSARDCRSADRFSNSQGNRNFDLGFRLSRTQ